MPRISSGKRYAQAAFELALEKNELDGWRAGLERMAELSRNEDLMALLQSPRAPFHAKEDLLHKQFGELHPLISNLALLLVHKGIFRLSGDVFQQYNALLDAYRGVERAKVTDAVRLSDEDKEAISSRLGKVVDRKVAIDAQVDASLIGGFIARMGDMLIDGSIRQRLESLKKSLVEVQG
jgi:F-type H+-transporting ATPase subunit delta